MSEQLLLNVIYISWF